MPHHRRSDIGQNEPLGIIVPYQRYRHESTFLRTSAAADTQVFIHHGGPASQAALRLLSDLFLA